MSAPLKHPLVGQPLTYSPMTPPQARDVEAMVREHLPMVRRIAWHVHGSMSALVEVEDLVQTGMVALVECAATFEIAAR